MCAWFAPQASAPPFKLNKYGMQIRGIAEGIEGTGITMYGDRGLPKGYRERHAAEIGAEQAKSNVISLINEIVVMLENYKFLHEEEEWEWADVVDWSRGHGLCRAQVPCCTDPCPLALAQLRAALRYAYCLYGVAADLGRNRWDYGPSLRDWSVWLDAQRLSSTRPHPGVGRPGQYVQKGVSPVYGLHVSERVFPSDNGPWGTAQT